MQAAAGGGLAAAWAGLHDGNASRILFSQFSKQSLRPWRSFCKDTRPCFPLCGPHATSRGPFPHSPQQGRSAQPGLGSQRSKPQACSGATPRLAGSHAYRAGGGSGPPGGWPSSGPPGGWRQSSPSGFCLCSLDSGNTWQLGGRGLAQGSPGVRPSSHVQPMFRTDRHTDRSSLTLVGRPFSPTSTQVPLFHEAFLHAHTRAHTHTRLCGCRRALASGPACHQGVIDVF